MFERPIDRHHRAICAASSAWLDDIVAFDEAKEWQTDGTTSMSAWMAGRYNMARGTAREWVRVAHAMCGLPAMKAAFHRGEICFDQLKALTRFVTAEEDGAWARRAASMSTAELWAECRRRQRRARDEAEVDSKLRYVWKTWDEDRRMLHGEFDLPGEQGVAFEEALEKASEDVVVEDDVRDPEGARLADALVGLVTSGSTRSAKPIVVVHTDVEALGGSDGPAETGDVALATETVQRLACDAVLEWVIERGGRPIGIGRRSPKVPAWLRRQVAHRDRGCRFPGCGHTRWTDAHHIRHWTNGGRTDLDNLVQLCGAHHRLIHEGGWTIRGHPGGRLRFHDPGGRRAFARAGPEANAA